MTTMTVITVRKAKNTSRYSENQSIHDAPLKWKWEIKARIGYARRTLEFIFFSKLNMTIVVAC